MRVVSGVVAMVGLVVGCSGGSSSVQGEQDGACLPDSTCNPGLECVDGTCKASDADAGAPDAGPQGAGCDSTQPNFEYVVNQITIPETAASAQTLGQDIDGDEVVDNALGGLLGALAATADLDLQADVDLQIARGEVIQLLSLAAANPADSAVAGLCTYVGTAPSIAPCSSPSDTTCGLHLQGTALFAIAADSPDVAPIEGSIATSAFATLPPVSTGIAVLLLPLNGTSALLPVEATQVTVETSSSALMNGKLGGALSTSTVDEVLIPALAAMIALQVSADCSPLGSDCNCTFGSAGESMLSFFDANGDCAVPAQEFASNSLIDATLRSPDLDLLDDAGLPGSDGIPDHLSLGFGFTAVAASF